MMNSRNFAYVCSMKDFIRNILVFTLALVFGLSSAALCSADVEREFVKSENTQYPYSLIDDSTQSVPIQSFVALVPVERIAAVTQPRVPASPLVSRVWNHTDFASEQQFYCLLASLHEKEVKNDYGDYKSRLCYDGHYLYTFCKLLI